MRLIPKEKYLQLSRREGVERLAEEFAQAVDRPLACREFVHHYDVAAPIGGKRHLLDVCDEQDAVHRTVDHLGTVIPEAPNAATNVVVLP